MKAPRGKVSLPFTSQEICAFAFLLDMTHSYEKKYLIFMCIYYHFSEFSGFSIVKRTLAFVLDDTHI